MAVVILTHVFFAFFAVGGSTLAVFSEWWGGKKKDNDYIKLAKGLSKFLSDMMKINGVLGVAIVVLSIGLWSQFAAFLYSTQFWPFLIEGAVFLFLMIFSVIYHNTWDSMSRGLHIFVGMLTALFAMLAALFINSIWIFMMVPGEKWMETQSRWDAFNTPVLIESTIHMLLPCMINGALIIFVWSFWKAGRPGADQPYYAKVNKFTGAIGASLLFLQPLSGASFLWKVYSSTEKLDPPNPWTQLSGGAAQPFLYIMISLASLAMIGAIIYWVRKHDKGRTALLVASFFMFSAFFMGAYTREKARKPYLIWNVMGMDQRFTKTMQDKGIGGTAKQQVGAVINGEQVFQGCKGCHSYKGQGGSIGPDLTNIPEKYKNKKTELMSFISQPPSPANSVMTPFSGSDAELDALADYLLKK
jgi:cytochrome bd-type quinol oxidase subunit 1